MDKQIDIRVRTANRLQLRVSISLSSSILQLKELLSSRTNLPPPRQRLIYQGRQLKDEDKITDCRIEQDHVVHLVAAEAQNLLSSSLPETDLSPRGGLFRMEIRRPYPSEAGIRRRTDQTQEISQMERLEAIRQNLVSIECLLRCRVDPRVPDSLAGFDFSKRFLSPGQWVDALDTTDQWLEAQVVQVQTFQEECRVFIHYNGWPTHWDEWLYSDSERIQLLGTCTSHNPAAPTQSPFPHTPPDALNVRNEEIELAEAVKRASALFSPLKKMLDRYQQLKVGNSQLREQSILSSQLIPLLDRAGRLISDLGRVLDSGVGLISTMLTQAELVDLTAGQRPEFDLSFVLREL